MASKTSFYRMIGNTIERRTGARFDGQVWTRKESGSRPANIGLDFARKDVDFKRFEAIAEMTVGEFGTYTFCSSGIIVCHELCRVDFDISVPDYWVNDDYATIAKHARENGWVVPQDMLPYLPEGDYNVSQVNTPMEYRRRRREEWGLG